jgi:hypothetical protein
MDPVAIIGAIEAALNMAVELAPTAIKAEQVIAPIAQALWDHIVNKKVVTQTDLDALNAQLSATSARIQGSLPPEQSDDV